MNLGLLFLLSVFLLVGAEDVKIYHRLWDGISQPSPQFVLRTTIGDSFNQSNAQETLEVINDAHDVYQIAVQTNSDRSWVVSSTKAVRGQLMSMSFV